MLRRIVDLCPLARGGAAAIIFMPARSSPQTEAHSATEAVL